MPGPGSQAVRQRTIFVVDDDPGFLRLVERALRREGYVTASAGSFEQAVDWLQAQQPDLMLLDLKLQDIGGGELIDYLTVHGRPVPFIVMTGQGDERVAVAMMKRGAIDYLVKDIEFLQLVPEVVRRALDRLDRDRKLAAAEEALRRSEANLARAQQIAHLGSYELNITAAAQDYFSEEIYRILGVDSTREDVPDREAIERMVHPADLMSYRDALDRAVREAVPFQLEYRVIRPDASVRFVQSIGEPVLDRDGQVAKVLGTLLDVTERKRGELRQQVQYATTRGLAESATLTEAAPRILEAVGQTLDWDRGEFWEIDARSGALRCLQSWRAVQTPEAPKLGGEPRQPSSFGPGLASHVAKGGKVFWSSDLLQDQSFGSTALALQAGFHAALALPVLLAGQVLGVAAFYSRAVRAVDLDLLQLVTALGSQIGQFIERTRAEEALRKEHNFTSAVLETSAALVMVLDRRGRIVRFNRACEQISGYSAGEVKGQLVWDLFVLPEEMEAARALFAGAHLGQKDRNELYWITRDQGKRLIAWSNGVLRDDEGAVEYVISAGLDVTERRRLEQEILQISDLEQRRIGQDLHDGLCQHLAATELMCEILQQKLARKSKADARRVAEIGKQVREAISQTRLLARGLSPVLLESEGLMAALQQLCDYTEKLFYTACAFHCPEPVLVQDHGAATHLYRIAQEAVSNAIRHGKAKQITISLQQTAERISLRILDDGVGLPDEFAQAKGMGLRIMQYRAAMIGAFLTVQKAAGGGTLVACSRPVKPG